MTDFVLDTDVFSFLFKGDTRARSYEPHLLGAAPNLSFMTVAELDRWAIVYRWGAARKLRLKHFARPFPVVYPDRRLCQIWASVTSEAQKHGRPLDCADAWIAATAITLGCPLVTHNAGDYVGVPSLTIISEAP